MSFVISAGGAPPSGGLQSICKLPQTTITAKRAPSAARRMRRREMEIERDGCLLIGNLFRSPVAECNVVQGDYLGLLFAATENRLAMSAEWRCGDRPSVFGRWNI